MNDSFDGGKIEKGSGRKINVLGMVFDGKDVDVNEELGEFLVEDQCFVEDVIALFMDAPEDGCVDVGLQSDSKWGIRRCDFENWTFGRICLRAFGFPMINCYGRFLSESGNNSLLGCSLLLCRREDRRICVKVADWTVEVVGAQRGLYPEERSKVLRIIPLYAILGMLRYSIDRMKEAKISEVRDETVDNVHRSTGD
jgi:hypothetical protein